MRILRIVLGLALLNEVSCIPTGRKTSASQTYLTAGDEHPHHVELSAAYNLYWSFTEEDITFEIHVETTGWAGFGISPNGGMISADLIIGWIDEEHGDPHFHVSYLEHLISINYSFNIKNDILLQDKQIVILN